MIRGPACRGTDAVNEKLGSDLDAGKALGLAGKGPVLRLHVEVAEPEGQAHCVEPQQLCAVHHGRKVAAQRGVVSPQALQEGGAILKSRPGEMPACGINAERHILMP